jgi:hypothetical protein
LGVTRLIHHTCAEQGQLSDGMAYFIGIGVSTCY